MKYFRSEIKEGDDILFRNICKEKKKPGTKKQLKDHGPVTASKVTQSHALVLKADIWKMKKVPLNISRKYHSRTTTNSSKRKSPALPTDTSAPKKIKKNTNVILAQISSFKIAFAILLQYFDIYFYRKVRMKIKELPGNTAYQGTPYSINWMN